MPCHVVSIARSHVRIIDRVTWRSSGNSRRKRKDERAKDVQRDERSAEICREQKRVIFDIYDERLRSWGYEEYEHMLVIIVNTPIRKRFVPRHNIIARYHDSALSLRSGVALKTPSQNGASGPWYVVFFQAVRIKLLIRRDDCVTAVSLNSTYVLCTFCVCLCAA